MRINLNITIDRPQVLDLTAAEELIVIDNLEIFEANGFGVEILQDNEPTKRVKLVSHATSKNTVFDKHGTLDFYIVEYNVINLNAM